MFNQLATSSSGGSQSYSYAGTTNTERVTAGATTFTNGLLGQVSSTGGTPTASYVREPSGNLIAMQYGGSSYYYTTDTIKSVIALTDPSQAVVATYTYDPYGTTTTATGTMAAANPYRYASGYTDNLTNLIKFGARYYNPTHGRFTQPDPSGQETNAYAYAGNHPVGSSDPSGLDWNCTPFGGCWDDSPTPPMANPDECVGAYLWAIASVVSIFTGAIIAGAAGGLATSLQNETACQ